MKKDPVFRLLLDIPLRIKPFLFFPRIFLVTINQDLLQSDLKCYVVGNLLLLPYKSNSL